MKRNGTLYPLTHGVLPFTSPYEAGNATGIAGNSTGITYRYESETECIFNSSQNFGFVHHVLCDKNVTAQGAAQIVSVKGSNTCTP